MLVARYVGPRKPPGGVVTPWETLHAFMESIQAKSLPEMEVVLKRNELQRLHLEIGLLLAKRGNQEAIYLGQVDGQKLFIAMEG